MRQFGSARSGVSDVIGSRRMKFLLTNDDGIAAPGLAALEAAAQRMGETLVVAPQLAHSGCSHTVTTNRPLTAKASGANRYFVDGTPADCVRLGLTKILPNCDWVLSGINSGANLGADLYISGTAAAAREAAFLGKPAVAISQYRRRDREIDWTITAEWALCVLRDLVRRSIPAGSFYNVNLPHLDPGASTPTIVECPADTLPLPMAFREEGGAFHYEGVYHLRPRSPGGDVDNCFSGKITVSLIKLG